MRTQPLVETTERDGQGQARVRLEYYRCKRCNYRFRKRPRSQRRQIWLALKCPKCGSSVSAHTGEYKKVYYLPNLNG